MVWTTVLFPLLSVDLIGIGYRTTWHFIDAVDFVDFERLGVM